MTTNYRAPDNSSLARDLFCPGCGKGPVYEENGEGDYYVGKDFWCLACGSTFNLPYGVTKDPSLGVKEPTA